METVYFYCSVIGGVFLVLQVLLMLISGGESDFDTDASPELDVVDIDASYVLFQLSLKTSPSLALPVWLAPREKSAPAQR